MFCPIKFAVLGLDDGVIITEYSTQNGESYVYKSKYIWVEIVKLVCDKMNLTKIFLAPFLDFDLDSFLKEFGDLEEGLSDVLTGFIPLIPSF